MFCPSCGSEYTKKTKYCKQCGQDLSLAGVTEAPKKTQPNVTVMFLGVIAFCLTMMAFLVITYDVLSRDGLNGRDDILLGFVMAFSSAVALLLIWQLARMITAFRRTAQNVTIEKHFIREVPAIQPVASAGQIPGVVDPGSVVEPTTRQMAGVYGEPKAVK